MSEKEDEQEVDLFRKLLDAQNRVTFLKDSATAISLGDFRPSPTWFAGASDTCQEIEDILLDVMEFGEDCLQQTKMKA